MTPLQRMIEMARQESAAMIADAPTPFRGRPVNGAARTAIITILREKGELSRQEIADGIGVTVKKFDHYVAWLESEGQVRRRRLGHKMLFRLTRAQRVQREFDL